MFKIAAPYDPKYTIEQNIDGQQTHCLLVLNKWPLYEKWESLKHNFMIDVFLTISDDKLTDSEKLELLKQKYETVRKKCSRVYNKHKKTPNGYDISK